MGRKIEDHRSFVIQAASVGDTKPGRYVSTSPFGAARKAALKLFKAFPDVDEAKFVLREITRTTLSTNQMHTYMAKKFQEPPRVVNKIIKDATGAVIKNIEYTVSVRVEIKSLNAAEVSDLVKQAENKLKMANAEEPTTSSAQAVEV